MDLISHAFAKDNGLVQRITAVVATTPHHGPLFDDIARYVLKNSHSSAADGTQAGDEEPAAKKRKLLNGSLPIGESRSQARQVVFEAKDISFSIPQRKKLHLSVIQYGNNADTSFAVCVSNPSTNEVELEMPVSSTAYAMRLPIPEKAQKQFNYCLMPKSTTDASNSEPLLWTVNYGPLKNYSISSPDLQQVISGSDDVLEQVFDHILQRSGKNLVYPIDSEFISATPEAHRKGDKAYHVKAFRGSKDGYLFFLEDGIFFGFKKPLSFFAFESIESISYTSVLQRTFNLNILYKDNQATEPQEIEFSMLDQADFAGIDAYIKKHSLQDASMAEARRAKLNKATSKQAQAANEEEADGRSELQKAEDEMEDEEDELEEDYDPGSDANSDGSGGSSEDEDEYNHESEANLVEEELGSEAEDVEPDPEDPAPGRHKNEPNPDDEDQL